MSAAENSLAHQRSAPPHSISCVPALRIDAAVDGTESRHSVLAWLKNACV
jgi:hypothetical protein